MCSVSPLRHAPAPHLGEDIASEAFTFAWQYTVDRFAALGSDFGAWVHAPLHWQLARARRQREECRQRHLEHYAGHCHTLGSATASAHLRQRTADVLDVLATLRPERRQLALLCDYHGLSYEEAAADLGAQPCLGSAPPCTAPATKSAPLAPVSDSPP